MFGFSYPYDNTSVTVELRKIVESGVDIWNFEYPVPRATIDYNGKTCKVDFDKKTFEQKIVDHYYFRQIGQESVGRWLYYFRTRIREIMPYFVQLYEFDAKFRNIEDPLESYNLVETFKQETSGNASTNTEHSDESETVRKFSNTPQGSLANLDNYLTEATKDNGNGSGSSSGSSESSGSVEHTLTKRGNIGVQPLGGEVENIRHALINIDQMVINELNDLFLQVY